MRAEKLICPRCLKLVDQFSLTIDPAKRCEIVEIECHGAMVGSVHSLDHRNGNGLENLIHELLGKFDQGARAA